MVEYKCHNCGALLYKQTNSHACLECGKVYYRLDIPRDLPADWNNWTRFQKSDWYEENKQTLIDDIDFFGVKKTAELWGLPLGTLYSISASIRVVKYIGPYKVEKEEKPKEPEKDPAPEQEEEVPQETKPSEIVLSFAFPTNWKTMSRCDKRTWYEDNHVELIADIEKYGVKAVAEIIDIKYKTLANYKYKYGEGKSHAKGNRIIIPEDRFDAVARAISSFHTVMDQNPGELEQAAIVTRSGVAIALKNGEVFLTVSRREVSNE